ncbi:MAG: hypothetical protein GOMPHAMPRED_005419 [Gomphillus americanus]|uniref:Uncharacterized protein n=1 Tax=Gomphillus americanus TaxID=1940652 RepID=A0A8H3IWB3_9LECA|nr:MAG: hypothetical protein GOMPHAMPRED_005419 [Gomphillus americanus]
MDATAQRAALQNLTVRTENTTVEFALQPNKIVMRGRHFMKCATGDRSDAFERDFLFNVHICDHVRRFGEFGSEIVQLTHCRPYKLRQDPSSKECAAEKYCSLCPTEFESHTVSLNEAEYLFIITRWLDLGSGVSPNESNYRSHMVIGSAHWINGHLHPFVGYEPGSIKAAFESACLN